MAYLVIIGVSYVLFNLWRIVRPDLTATLRPAWGALGTLCLFALFGVVAPGDRQDLIDWGLTGLWLFGTSLLAVTLLVWRIWMLLAPRTACTWSMLPPLALVLPALPMTAGATDHWNEVMVIAWTIPGYAGVVPLALLLLLLFEVNLRILRRRRHPESAPTSDAKP